MTLDPLCSGTPPGFLKALGPGSSDYCLGKGHNCVQKVA